MDLRFSRLVRFTRFPHCWVQRSGLPHNVWRSCLPPFFPSSRTIESLTACVCVCVCDHLIDTDSLIKRGWPSLRNGPVELVHKKPICALKHGLAFSTTPPPPHTHTHNDIPDTMRCVWVCACGVHRFTSVSPQLNLLWGVLFPFFFFLKTQTQSMA